MPEAPDLHPVPQLSYITNYFLMGCTPPQYLVVDFCREPAKDLLMLFVVPDIQDIVQEIIGPSHSKRKGPKRRGRRRPSGLGIPDISAIIGGFIRGKVNTADRFNFGPTRIAFKLLNAYELVAFSFAIIDEFTDLAFANFWGMAAVYPDHCRDFARISRELDEPFTIIGAGPPLFPFRLRTQIFNTGFFDGDFGTNCNSGTWTISLVAVIRGIGDAENQGCRLALGIESGTIIAQSEFQPIPFGDFAHLEVTATLPANQFCGWGLSDRTGVFEIVECKMLAFRTKLAFD